MEKKKDLQGSSLMGNKKLLIFSILLLNLIMIGAVSGSYTGSAAALDRDLIKSSGVSYALLVGVSTYKDPSNNLNGVQFDTPHMSDMLISDCGYSPSRITSLEDSQATKSAIRSALIQMSSRAGTDDIVVFYFSGHGMVYPSYYGTSYIQPYDSATDSLDYDISSSELKEWLDGIRCRNVLVIIDACEAEGMLKGTTKELVTGSPVMAGSDKASEADRFSQNFLGTFESPNTVALSSADQKKALTGDHYVVLVSCRSGEGSWTNPVSGSWFTTYFVEGIGNPSADTNIDSWVSAEEAFAYSSPLTILKHYDQHPVLYDGDPYNDLQMANYGSSSTGTIDVQSVPAGAAVYLDGMTTGYKTPATLAGISAGSHTVRCSMTGYTDQSQSVTVSAGRTATVKVYLISPVPATGSVSVSSSPSGARIYLDGTDTGYKTPATLAGISAGSHMVRCSMAGYSDQSQSVTVNAGKTTGVVIKLQGQFYGTGSVSVSSSPSGARIYLDGTDTGYITPKVLTGISAGSHTVRCSMTGYTDQSQSVTVTAGQISDVVLTLPVPETATGSIYVTSQPSRALVYLDGKYQGLYTPATISKVTAGTHTVRVAKYGYKDRTQSVDVTAGTTSPVSLILSR